jgi:hypothetical protein
VRVLEIVEPALRKGLKALKAQPGDAVAPHPRLTGGMIAAPPVLEDHKLG